MQTAEPEPRPRDRRPGLGQAGVAERARTGEGSGPDPALGSDVPPVVAVVVTRNPGDFLERSLAALAAQDYPDLAVLVVDAGSRVDPTARVAAVLPGAFVRTVDPDAGFGGAANEALAAVDGASFFLVCHDDVELDPSAVRLLVEEAFRSNAAIVGPKLVAADNPDELLEVGRAIDRLGGSHTGIEPGELDQEQHDSVRDVFYVSSAAMLVRADLFTELGGFDAETFPGSEDLDLCWRARLAGARVMVVPDARGLHHEASSRAETHLSDIRAIARNRVRVVLTCYSLATLLWVVPAGLILSCAEVLAFGLTRRRRAAFAAFGAWWWNLVHLGRFRDARRRAQSSRSIRDGELRELQVGPSARFGAFLTQHHADERLELLGERTRDALEVMGERLTHPLTFALGGFLLLLLFGSRSLFSGGVPAIGTLMPWPGVRALGDTFGSAWRSTGMGSTAPPSPAIAMMGGLGTVLFGSVGLAQTLVVVGSFAAGATGAYRLARSLGGPYVVAIVTAVAYGANPVPRNAVAQGRLGPLVLFAAVPFLAALLVRCGGFRELAGSARRPLLGLTIVTALTGAWYPPALLVPVVLGLVLLMSSVFARETIAAARATGAALVAGAGAALLLAPWSATFADVSDDPAAFGLAFHPHLDLASVVRFQTGASGGGIASWGLLAAAGVSLFLATGPRLAWAVRSWGLALTGYALVYLPARFAPGTAVAAPEAGLTLAALGLAAAAGIGAGALATELGRARIVDWRRAAAVLACAGVVLLGFGFAADSIDGRWRAPERTWHDSLDFARDLQFEGEFRVLWVGDPDVLPMEPLDVRGALSYVLTRNGGGDARELWRAPAERADKFVGTAVVAALDGRTSRLGRVLSPLGVRYIALPALDAPGGTRHPPPPGVGAALAAQLDLTPLTTEAGLVLYANDAWVPARAVLTERNRPVPADPGDPLRSMVDTPLGSAEPLGDAPVSAGTVLLSEAHDAGWHAEARGAALAHQPAFGVVNQFDLPGRSTVDIGHDGEGRRFALIAGEAALWIAALVWWGRGRRRVRTRKERVARDRERERATHRDVYSDLDDDFWYVG